MTERANGEFSSRTRFHNVSYDDPGVIDGLFLSRERGRPRVASEEEQFLSKQEREKFSQEVNATLHGLNRYLQAQSEGKDFIIDMYNVPPVETSPISTNQAIKDLRRHTKRIVRELERRRLPEVWAVKRDGIVAAVTYLEEREKPKNKRLPYDDLLRRISGTVPMEIPIPELEADRRRLMSLLKSSGLDPIGQDNQGLIGAYQLYHDWRRVTDKDQIERGLMNEVRRFRSQLSNVLKTDLRNVDFMARFVEDDKPYMAWEKRLPEGNFLDINVHPDKMLLWGLEEILRYARHEWMHFVDGHLQTQEIEEGRLDSIAGYLLIPSPECWTLEGVAQTIDELSGLEPELDGKISVAHYRVYVKARTNALLYLERGQKTMLEAVEFMERYAPHKSPELVAKELKDGTEDIFWEVYLPIYGTSDREIIRLADGLKIDSKRNLLLHLLKTPMTHSQFTHNYSQLSDF